MTEHQIQTLFFEILKLNEKKYPSLKFVFAVPNGGHRHVAVATKLKREGVKRGVFDVLFFHRTKDYSGLAIEFKAGKNKLTPEQKEFQSYLETQGIYTAVCYSVDQALDEIEKYLEIELTR